MEKTSPIIVSGSIAIDRIMSFTGHFEELIQPEHIGHLSVSMLLDHMHDSHGGVGANIAHTLALLGESPILLGSVGSDAQARAYVDKLTKSGVITASIHRSKLPTASFSVITDSNENQVGGFYPGAMFDSDDLRLEPWKDLGPLVVVSPHDPKAMARQVEECKRWGLTLCYDVGQQVTSLPADDMAIGVEAADILIVNEYEMSILSKKIKITPEQLKKRVAVVVTTLGKRGSVVEGAKVDKPITVGIAKAKQVADPTGAGDAYRAGFLYGFSHEWSLEASAQLGATCASFVLEQSGTQGHAFTREQLAERYNEAFKQPLPAMQTTT